MCVSVACMEHCKQYSCAHTSAYVQVFGNVMTIAVALSHIQHSWETRVIKAVPRSQLYKGQGDIISHSCSRLKFAGNCTFVRSHNLKWSKCQENLLKLPDLQKRYETMMSHILCGSWSVISNGWVDTCMFQTAIYWWHCLLYLLGQHGLSAWMDL